jgi:hypothetical protein
MLRAPALTFARRTSVSTQVGVPDRAIGAQRSAARDLRGYFFSDTTRSVQTVLGLIWCLDGGLQFQSFMYSHGFVALLKSGAVGQPGWVHDSIIWAANLGNGNLTVWNTLFALVQCLLGLGLLYRPLVKPALAASFLWVLIVWWFGEAFGMMFMNMAQPLTGAPGGVLMYGLVGLVVWPNGRVGGLLGVRGSKIMWAALWLVMAWLWLLAPSSAANATSSVLNSVPSGIGPLDSFRNTLASATAGSGLVIALVLAALTAVIGLAVARGWRARTWLYVSIALNLVYWIIPQGFGGIFAGGATDPNAGPLFMLLAIAMLPVVAGTNSQLDSGSGGSRRATGSDGASFGC